MTQKNHAAFCSLLLCFGSHMKKWIFSLSEGVAQCGEGPCEHKVAVEIGVGFDEEDLCRGFSLGGVKDIC